mgnify:CR=1 FL=1
MRNIIFKTVIGALIASFLPCSCSKSDSSEPEDFEDGKGGWMIRFRSDVGPVEDVNVYLYNTDGTLAGEFYTDSPSEGMDMRECTGVPYKVCALANIGRQAAPRTELEADNFSYTIGSIGGRPARQLPLVYRSEGYVEFTKSRRADALDVRLTNVGASFELGVDKSSMDGGFIEFVSATLEQAVSVMRPFAGISLREGTARYVQTATPSELVGLNGGNTVPFVVTCPGDDVVTPVFKVGVRIHRVDGSSLEQEYAFELNASCGEQLPLSWEKVYRLVLSVIPYGNHYEGVFSLHGESSAEKVSLPFSVLPASSGPRRTQADDEPLPLVVYVFAKNGSSYDFEDVSYDRDGSVSVHASASELHFLTLSCPREEWLELTDYDEIKALGRDLSELQELYVRYCLGEPLPSSRAEFDAAWESTYGEGFNTALASGCALFGAGETVLDLTAYDGGTVELEVTRPYAMVWLRKLPVESLGSLVMTGATGLSARCYLTNVRTGVSSLFSPDGTGTGWANIQGFHNAYPYESGMGTYDFVTERDLHQAGTRWSGMLDDTGILVPLYAMPNDTQTDHFYDESWAVHPSRKTRLVVELTYDPPGADGSLTYYYPVTLDNLHANTAYVIDEFTVTRPGSDNPDKLVNPSDMTVTVSTTTWEDIYYTMTKALAANEK